jgi:molybdopterin-containing oxidoreductase family membrane subunit
VDYAILCGSFGWFSMWFMLFIKQLPVIAISEVKEIVPPKLRTSHPHGIDAAGRHFEYEADTPGEFA